MSPYGAGGLPGPMGSWMRGSQTIMNAINQPMRALSRVSHMLSQSFQALHMSMGGILNMAMGAQMMKLEASNAFESLQDSQGTGRTNSRGSRRCAPAPTTWSQFFILWATTYTILRILRYLYSSARQAMLTPRQALLHAAWRSTKSAKRAAQLAMSAHRAAPAQTAGGEVFGTNLIMSYLLLMIARFLFRVIQSQKLSRDIDIEEKKNRGLEGKKEFFEKGWKRLKKDTRLAEALGSTQVVHALLAAVEGRKVPANEMDNGIKKLMIEKRCALEIISRDSNLVRRLCHQEVVKKIQTAQCGDEPVPVDKEIREVLEKLEMVLQENNISIDDAKQLDIQHSQNPNDPFSQYQQQQQQQSAYGNSMYGGMGYYGGMGGGYGGMMGGGYGMMGGLGYGSGYGMGGYSTYF